jgi:hypothetical protein
MPTRSRWTRRAARDLTSGVRAVAPDGYKWVEGQHQDGFSDQFLISVSPRPATTLPGGVPSTLFRDFGALEPACDPILGFATTFGRLGLAEVFVDAERRRENRGESLASWRAEILGMRHALSVWDALHHGDDNRLKECFTSFDFGSEDGAYVGAAYRPRSAAPLGAYQLLGTAHADWSVVERLSPRKLRREVRVFKFEVFVADWPRLSPRRRLRVMAQAFLQGVVGDRLGLWARPKVIRDDAGAFRLSMSPTGLIGTVWLQLLATVEGGYSHRRCPSCQAWIEVSPHDRGRRQGIKYCTARCRVSGWRRNRRRQRARSRGPRQG